MRNRIVKSGLAVGASAVLLTGAAFAATHHAPQKPTTTPQSALTITLNAPKNYKQKTCKGTDGNYVLVTGTYAGTSSGSTDSRLNGNVSASLRSLVNTTTGDGSTVGTIQWTAAKSKKVTANGKVSAVDVAAGSVTQPNTLKGFITAGVHGIAAVKKGNKVVTPAVPPATLYANVAGAGSPTSGWTVNTGTQNAPAVDARAPAILQSGNC